MNTTHPSICRWLIAATALLPGPRGRAADEKIFRAGFAEQDVSPQVGDEAPGSYGKVRHKAFHDPCKARAAVFDDGTAPVAIVGVDALLVRKPTVEWERRTDARAAGPSGRSIPREALELRQPAPRA